MEKLTLDAEALLAAVILDAQVFVLGPARLAWMPTIAGTVILIVLLAFEKGRMRSFGQSVAYAASCGFVLATSALFPVTQYLTGFTRPIDALTSRPVLPAIFIAGTLVFLIADRVRNTSTPITVRLSSVNPVDAPAQPVAAPATFSPERTIPERGVEVKAQPAPKGKPATIYLNLLDSGIACLRPVQAEKLGNDFYRIVEAVPAGEEWEFRTGQIVRCRKQSLSSGKGLVAFEEAPRVN